MKSFPHKRKKSAPIREGIRRDRKTLAVLALVTVFLLAGASGFRMLLSKPTQSIGGAYMLFDTQGHKVTQDDFQGRYTALYFGYTHCIDVCPLTLDTISTALERLGPEGRKVVPIFISVDPQRDTPAVMRTYLARFSPRIIGLSGSAEQLKPVLETFHVTTHRRDRQDSDYLIDHTSILYVMDGRNHLAGMIPIDDSAEQMAVDLARVLRKN